MNEKNKADPEKVFTHWKNSVNKELGKSRYTQKDREEPLAELCEQFFIYKIDYEVAQTFGKKVLEFMVTNEGRKGQGKYKGWSKSIIDEFESNLFEYYRETLNLDTREVVKYEARGKETYGTVRYMDRQSLIVAWSKMKFDENWTEAILSRMSQSGKLFK